MTRRKIQYWVIPPQADAEFVAHMEQVLDLYQKPYDPDCPVVCMDEQPVQLVKETRPPMAATKNRPRRVDYEYERAGTAAVFLFSEPLAGWRQATARARRTKVDWALEVAGLLDGRYADCPKITLVCDHLNTHTKGAFYQVFEPARARELVRRIEFCHTPKHGSWLNIAENELSSMTRQCVRGRRIGDLGTLHDEVSAWSTDVNGTQRGVDWQMKVDDARCKLKSVYPQIMTCGPLGLCQRTKRGAARSVSGGGAREPLSLFRQAQPKSLPIRPPVSLKSRGTTGELDSPVVP